MKKDAYFKKQFGEVTKQRTATAYSNQQKQILR